MKHFTVKVENADFILEIGRYNEVRIKSYLVLDCGNSVEIISNFNTDGDMIKFSLYNDGSNSLEFYGEISEAIMKVNKIKNNIGDILSYINESIESYKNDVSSTKQQISDYKAEIENLKGELSELGLKYKKARGANRVNFGAIIAKKKFLVNEKEESIYNLEDKVNDFIDKYIKDINRYICGTL